MPSVSSHFKLVVGDDDFLVDREARALFEKISVDATDEMSREIVSAVATKAAEVESVISAFLNAERTVSLFGGKKYVWLRNLNWLADGVIRTKPEAEGAASAKKSGKGKKASSGGKDVLEAAVDQIVQEFESSDPAAVEVVISVVRPDKRRVPAKKLLQVGEVSLVASMTDSDDLVFMLEKEARALGVEIEPDAAQLLSAKVNAHMRMMFSELEKLACYVGPGGTIDSALVMRLVSVFGAGNFFEPVEYFFAGDLAGTLDALRRFFFNNSSARPLIAAMQNRNRLLIQLCALVASGEASLNYRGGISKGEIAAAGARYAGLFGGNAEKSSLNLFSQNAWYVGEKLAGTTLRHPWATLKNLIDFQLEFLRAFRELVARPGKDEAVMRALAVRCLGR